MRDCVNDLVHQVSQVDPAFVVGFVFFSFDKSPLPQEKR
jgi:hypothetical protein